MGWESKPEEVSKHAGGVQVIKEKLRRDKMSLVVPLNPKESLVGAFFFLTLQRKPDSVGVIGEIKS